MKVFLSILIILPLVASFNPAKRVFFLEAYENTLRMGMGMFPQGMIKMQLDFMQPFVNHEDLFIDETIKTYDYTKDGKLNNWEIRSFLTENGKKRDVKMGAEDELLECYDVNNDNLLERFELLEFMREYIRINIKVCKEFLDKAPSDKKGGKGGMGFDMPSMDGFEMPSMDDGFEMPNMEMDFDMKFDM